MKSKHILSLITIFLLIPFTCKAYLDRDLHQINMQNGLSDNIITSIYKDKDGFAWFGTSNGISRYDGEKVVNYRYKDVYSNITDITEGFDGLLTFISNGTLSAFDLRKERFITVTNGSNQPLQANKILVNNDSCLWIITGNKLKLIKKIKYGHQLLVREETKYTNGGDDRIELADLSYSSDRSKICIADIRGRLIFLNANSLKPTGIESLNDNKFIRINSILYDNNMVWVCTEGHGLINYNLLTKKVTQLSYSKQTSKSRLSHTDVFDIVRINSGKYLAVTWNGYTTINVREGSGDITTEVFSNTSSLMYRNLETRMVSVCYDSSGILWIGTDGGGIIWSDLRMQFYKRFYQNTHNEICSIITDDDNYIWLSTFHNGIMRSEKPFSLAENLNFVQCGTKLIMQKETVLCSLKDSQGNLWFGNKDGSITFYDKRDKQFEIRTINGNSEKNEYGVWALLEDSKGDIWIGTSHGLWIFDHKRNNYRKVLFNNDNNLSSLSIRALVQTKDGSIWLGTSTHGICRVIGRDKLKYGYEDKYGNTGKSVRSLLAASDGTLYIGYRTGFALLYPKKDQIEKVYTTIDGLCNNFIGCIVEDDKGQIWLGSNSAVSRYSRHSHLFYNYYLSGSNRSAFCHDNILFWGNNKNLTYFNGNSTNSYNTKGDVKITGLDVNNKPVETGERINNQIILPENIFYASGIELNSDNRNFSLTFNNLSYSDVQQKYSYRLYPYQNNWIISNGNEKVSYANLEPGDYVFEVKNIYPDDNEGHITKLKITILPHWSETSLFHIFIFLIFGMLVYLLVYRIKLKQKRLRHELNLEQEVFAAKIECDKERQIRVERENFFTNAAHELRTPLTLILSPLQELITSSLNQEDISDRLNMMYRNGNSMKKLVDNLLYIQKIEAGMVSLTISRVDIVSLVKDITDSFDDLAKSTDYDYQVELLDKPLYLWIDTEKISSAIRNLLSNAFKYTSKHGMVKVNMKRICIDNLSYCSISVEDSGCGIPKNIQNNIFQSFITGNNNPLFSNKVGIGLRIVKNTMDIHHGSVQLESIEGKGSKFTLLIPEGKEHFKDDRYDEIDSNLIENDNEIDLSSNMNESRINDTENIKKRQILIIEDNTEIREYISSLFIKDYSVLQASNGEEGVETAISEEPDIIISDVMMPVKDGFECCKEIRENYSTSHIPILMLTAKSEDIDLVKASNLGADDYIMKPFNPEILISRVKNLVSQRERLKRIYTKTLMLSNNVDDKEKENDNIFVNQLISIIEAHISDKDFNVKNLADQMNMSQTTLYRKTKQCNNLSPIEIIRSVRMSKAASLILEKRYSMTEIVEMVGYIDTRTLRKHFMEQFGVSPSNFTK